MRCYIIKEVIPDGGWGCWEVWGLVFIMALWLEPL